LYHALAEAAFCATDFDLRLDYADVIFFDPGLYPLLILRMVKLTLKYGLCASTSSGFVAYGILLSRLRDVEGGFGARSCYFGEEVQSHPHRVGAAGFVPFYGMIAPFVEPWNLGTRVVSDRKRRVELALLAETTSLPR
jgi:hypothetical protein